MAWDIPDLPYDKFVERVRAHYGVEHFPLGVFPLREFEASPDGTYNRKDFAPAHVVSVFEFHNKRSEFKKAGLRPSWHHFPIASLQIPEFP